MVRRRAKLKPALLWKLPYDRWWQAYYKGEKVGEVFQSLYRWWVWVAGQNQWYPFDTAKHAQGLLEQAAFGGKQ